MTNHAAKFNRVVGIPLEKLDFMGESHRVSAAWETPDRNYTIRVTTHAYSHHIEGLPYSIIAVGQPDIYSKFVKCIDVEVVPFIVYEVMRIINEHGDNPLEVQAYIHEALVRMWVSEDHNNDGTLHKVTTDSFNNYVQTYKGEGLCPAESNL